MTSIASAKRRWVSQWWTASLLVAIGWPHVGASAQPLAQSELKAALDQLIDASAVARRTCICLKVVDLQSGDTIYDRHGDWLMTPASNLKMYTTACALATFPPDHRFATTIALTGSLHDGELDGDIVLRGGGDAMLTSQELEQLAEQLVKRHQLRKVRGTLRVDNRRYRSPPKGPGWMWDDEPYYFNATITPLMVDFNVLIVRVTPTEDKVAAVQLVPPTNYPPLEVIQNNHGDSLRVTRRPCEHAIRVSGVEHVNEPTDQQLTMHAPGKWVASIFKHMLVRRGVQFEPAAAPTDNEAAANECTIEHQSKPLREILKYFNEESVNAIGEVLLHEVAIARGVERPNWSDGAGLITKWLIEDAGLEEGSFRLDDGSGLSRYNLISADSSTRLVAYMHRHAMAGEFLAALPTYDVDLTKLAWDQPLPAAAGEQRVRAKSGYMSGVLTSSGVLRTLDERALAFSYLTAGFIGTSQPQRDLRHSIWETLVRYRAR